MINVDKVITISLNESHQRRLSTQKELAKIGLNTHFHIVERSHGDEERGCFNAHLAVCKKGLAENCHSLLVCEDDVKLLPYTMQQIDRINWFIDRRAKQFDLLYLGLSISKMWYCGLKSIVRAKGAAAHAYILSRKGMEKLGCTSYTGTPIDKLFKHDFKCYSVYPIIAEQFTNDIFTSSIAAQRNTVGNNNKAHWEKNYRKQKWQLWKNLLKTLVDR